MPFVGEILRCGSVSIVGLAKNAGKTEVLNYVLRRSAAMAGERSGVAVGEVHGGAAGWPVAVTSIGVDGEQIDRVTLTAKPEIEIYEGMVFVTSETHFRQRRLVAEVLDIGGRETSLGRLVTARALTSGKVLLSGPSDTGSLSETIARLHALGAGTVLVDGALSRLSHGSPAVTDAMVLATGAAVSGNIPRLVRETRYICDRIVLDAVEGGLAARLEPIAEGVWAVDSEGGVHDLGVRSVLMLDEMNGDMFRHGNTLYVPGIVSDKLLGQLRLQKNAADITLIVRDFTRIFATPETYCAFLNKGGRIGVLRRSKLLAVCVNPLSPEGFRLDGDRLLEEMRNALAVPVYDIMRMPGRQD